MSLPTTLGEALSVAQGQIDVREARLLLREASGASAAALAAFPERALAPDAAARFLDGLARRAAGEPIAYILGWREFYGRRFAVSPAVLIPRPDTELLVEAALARLADWPAPRVLDLGTGSGAIAISLALEAPHAQVSAVERSPDALAVAAHNAAALGALVRLRQGSWLEPMAGESFELVVSNPPYIRPGDPHLSQGDLRFEPLSALRAEEMGLADIETIIRTAPAHLVKGGWLMLEHGYDQAEAVRELLVQGGFCEVASLRDLAGIERVSLGCVSLPAQE